MVWTIFSLGAPYWRKCYAWLYGKLTFCFDSWLRLVNVEFARLAEWSIATNKHKHQTQRSFTVLVSSKSKSWSVEKLSPCSLVPLTCWVLQKHNTSIWSPYSDERSQETGKIKNGLWIAVYGLRTDYKKLRLGTKDGLGIKSGLRIKF